MNTEIEYKFIVEDKDIIENKLKNIGAKKISDENLVKIAVFDFTNKKELNKSGIYKWLRVRDVGTKVNLTMKQIFDNGKERDKHVKEIEIQVDSFDKTVEMLQETGLILSANQEKLHSTWTKGSTEFSVDRWPALPYFVEIESKSEEEAQKHVEDLGFNMHNSLTGAVSYIYQKVWGIEPSLLPEIKELTFEKESEVKKELIKLKIKNDEK